MFTRRGYAVVVVAVVAEAMSWSFGARSLNAVVAPILVALVAAVVQVWRIERPTVTRNVPTNGFVGERLPVRLRLDAPHAFDATVSDAVDVGLSATGNAVEATVADTTVTYRLDLDSRGEHRLGPVHVTARDVFGLYETTVTVGTVSDVVVFPTVYDLTGPARNDLDRLHRTEDIGRNEFDQLREYVRGDPLQAIHWKSSAKRPSDDLLVKQFDSMHHDREVTVVAEADDSRVDEVADATASVVSYLLDSGLAVALVTPDGRVGHDTGDDHLLELLTLLAGTDAGRVPSRTRDDAEVVVSAAVAADAAVMVDVEGVERTFVQLSGRRPDAWSFALDDRADAEPEEVAA